MTDGSNDPQRIITNSAVHLSSQLFCLFQLVVLEQMFSVKSSDKLTVLYSTCSAAHRQRLAGEHSGVSKDTLFSQELVETSTAKRRVNIGPEVNTNTTPNEC